MLKKLVVKTVAEVGKTMAKITVNTNCPWIHYQPKEPDAVKQLRLRDGVSTFENKKM